MPDELQLRRLVRHVALVQLAVERGVVPRQRLRRFLTSEAYRLVGDPRVSRFRGAGLPTPADVGAVALTRLPGGRVHAAVAARQGSDRWGALVVDLQQGGGRVRVTGLLRAQDRHLLRAPERKHAVSSTRERVSDERLLSRRVEVADGDLRLAVAAAQAEAGPGAERWERQAAQLETELDGLRTRSEHHAQLVERLDAEATVRLLGPAPQQPGARAAWESGRELIAEYRQRWGITDSPRALGSPPTDQAQRADRDDTLTGLRQLLPAIDADRAGRVDRLGVSRGHERDTRGRAEGRTR